MHRHHPHNNLPAMESSDRRYTWVALGSTALGVGIPLIAGAFSGGKKQQDDPLAPIRAQLMALSGQVPGLVAQQKQQIEEQRARAQKEGYEQIGEDLYASRGLGKTTIEGTQKSKLLEALTEKANSANLAAERWGVQTQADILGQAGGFTSPAEEEDNWLSSLGKSLGTAFGSRGDDDKLDFGDLLSKFTGGKGGTPASSSYTSLLEDLTKRHGVWGSGWDSSFGGAGAGGSY